MAATVTAAQVGVQGGQTIEGFVGAALDEAKISPLHIKIISLIAAGYFFDVIDYIVQGSLFPDMIKSGFTTPAGAAAIVSATTIGMFLGTAAQGEFTDRFGRRFVYQFNLLLFGVFTILGAFAPNITVLLICRFIAGLGLGAEQPLCFAYAGEYSPKRIRGRILAIIHFVGGACVWPISTLFVIAFRDTLHWQGVWICFGIGALIVWVLRFTLPESPRYLATHGRGKEAIGILGRLGIAGPTQPLSTDAASNTKSDPFAVVFSQFPVRVIAGMICFSAFFGVAIGLGGWLPNIMVDKGFTITKSLTFTLGMNLAVPCASIFMMYTLDKYGRKITSILRVCRRRHHGGRIRQRRYRHGASGRRLHHGLLHPGRRQCNADLRVGGVSDQRAGVGLRLGCRCRPARNRLDLAGHSVGARTAGA